VNALVTAAPTQQRRRPRILLWALLASVTIVGVLFIGVYPVRTYLAQRASLHRAERQIDVLKTQNDNLGQQTQQLNTDSEIERLAREQYNLVRPGERAFAILRSREEARLRDTRRLTPLPFWRQPVRL
jgi:cell division protein FtsB